MKKITTVSISIALTLALHAQVAEQNGAQQHRSDEGSVLEKTSFYAPSVSAKETVIWSEDFSGGIPTTWTNYGHNGSGTAMPNATWEYRGPTTTPSDTVGSRGQWNFGRGPIQSPTRSNGFMIFDSDYLDNYGISGNDGNGPAPAPHVGELTTDIIDLSTYPYLQLSFNSYHRYFEGRALIAFSTDGGTTWHDTIAAHPNISVNAQTAPNTRVEINVTNIITNQSNVRIKFIFDGSYDDPGANGAGGGYYFWMIDDLEITELPKNSLRFTGFNEAPEQDIIFGPTAGSGKMGFMTLNQESDQTRDIAFDANAYNYGYETQNNVKLTAYILDEFNTLITSFTSTTSVNLTANDTADYSNLNTYSTPFKPTSKGTYKFYYEVSSDSATVISDTNSFVVGDDYTGIDFNHFSNSLGTPDLGDDASALASRIDLVQSATLTSVWIRLSSTTVAGATIEISVYDTAGFDFTAGFPAANFIGAGISAYTITQSDITNGYIEIPVTDGTNSFVHLTNASYFIVATMYSNAGATPVRIANDQSVWQPRFSSLMYNTTDNRWYSYYTNSYTLNAPFIRANLTWGFGVAEERLLNAINVSPNPANEILNVRFNDLQGPTKLSLVDILGREVYTNQVDLNDVNEHQIDVRNFASGMYTLQITNNNTHVSKKIIIN